MSATPILAIEKGTVIWSRGRASKGVMTGASFPCTLSGCNGLRVAVRWSDDRGEGRMTFPCTKGLSSASGEWEIL